MTRAILIACAICACATAAFGADDPLAQLAERYATQQKTWQEAVQKATTEEEKTELLNRLHPVNTMVDDFLAVEQSHRGQGEGISALFQLIAHALSVWDPESPAAKGGTKAIQIIRDHYLEHSDLNLLTGRLSDGGAFVPESEGLLRDAMKSPHPHVRAAARYHLARFLRRNIELAEDWGPNAPATNSSNETAALAAYRAILRKQVKQMAIDPAAARAEAIGLIEQINAEDAEIVPGFVMREGPGRLSVRRATSEELGRNPTTFAKLAEKLRFELERLQKGQAVPEIVGNDADGVEFKISDYRGRVVLLMFSANWCGPCKAMYPDIRRLQAELEAEPFAVLAVMGDHKIDTVIEDTKSGEIRCGTWFDGQDGTIATRWNIDGWPTLFLIDHNGIIVSTRPSRSYADLKKGIDRLLAARATDPRADEELEAHPLPVLTIFKRAN